jgi:carbonic anhydrase
VNDAYPGLEDEEKLPVITRENVAAQLRNLMTHPSVAARMTRGELTLHGWIYNIRTGDVQIYEWQSSSFITLKDATPDAALAG